VFLSGECKKGLPGLVSGRAVDISTHVELEGIDQSTMGQVIPELETSLRVVNKALRVGATSGELAATERPGVCQGAGDTSNVCAEKLVGLPKVAVSIGPPIPKPAYTLSSVRAPLVLLEEGTAP
jgi:hypothetical protein